jgi:hypothetical protein
MIDTSEYGVLTASAPPKRSWLGSIELPTEWLSGTINWARAPTSRSSGGSSNPTRSPRRIREHLRLQQRSPASPGFARVPPVLSSSSQGVGTGNVERCRNAGSGSGFLSFRTFKLPLIGDTGGPRRGLCGRMSPPNLFGIEISRWSQSAESAFIIGMDLVGTDCADEEIRDAIIEAAHGETSAIEEALTHVEDMRREPQTG